MKFICSVTILQPKEVVVSYFSNPDYLVKYQEGFIKKELISGQVGKKDAISKMFYKQGKGVMELTETILENNLPNEFMAQYHHKFTDNIMRSTFTSLGENKTRYDAEIHYTALRGTMIKIIAFLFPSFFKKQVQKWLTNFKVFLEDLDLK